MDESIYILDMPDFRPVYSQKVLYGYSGKKGEKLKELLIGNKQFSLYVLLRILKRRQNGFGRN